MFLTGKKIPAFNNGTESFDPRCISRKIWAARSFCYTLYIGMYVGVGQPQSRSIHNNNNNDRLKILKQKMQLVMHVYFFLLLVNFSLSCLFSHCESFLYLEDSHSPSICFILYFTKKITKQNIVYFR